MAQYLSPPSFLVLVAENKWRMAHYLAQQCSTACQEDSKTGLFYFGHLLYLKFGVPYCFSLEYNKCFSVNDILMISHPGASTSSIGEMLRQKADEELANMETEQES